MWIFLSFPVLIGESRPVDISDLNIDLTDGNGDDDDDDDDEDEITIDASVQDEDVDKITGGRDGGGGGSNLAPHLRKLIQDKASGTCLNRVWVGRWVST